jgi:protein-disulfide isomerase
LTKWDISASKFAAEEAAATQAREDAIKKIDLTGRPVAGNKEAKVTIVNYDDFQCPFCARAHSTLFDNVIKQYGDHIKIIYKDYPLTEIHPWATRAAVNANCLGALNNDSYWAFADYVHANQKAIDGPDRRAVDAQKARLDGIARQIGTEHKLDMEKLNACIEKSDATAVMASAEEGNAVGVESTPTLFVNGEKLVGAVPPAALKRVIDKALTAAGVTPPEKPAVAETTVIPKNPNN